MKSGDQIKMRLRVSMRWKKDLESKLAVFPDDTFLQESIFELNLMISEMERVLAIVLRREEKEVGIQEAYIEKLRIKLKNLRLARADAKIRFRNSPDNMDLFRVLIEFESKILCADRRLNIATGEEKRDVGIQVSYIEELRIKLKNLRLARADAKSGFGIRRTIWICFVCSPSSSRKFFVLIVD